MIDETTDQARELYRTVRMLRGLLARKYSRKMKAEGAKPMCADLTFPQSNVLLVLKEEGGEMTIKDLASALGVSPPSASAMVDRLVEMGMLIREQSRIDRREVRVRLSEMGAETFAIMEEEILQVIVGLLKELGPDYSRQWCEVYGRIREIIAAQSANDSGDGVQEGEAV